MSHENGDDIVSPLWKHKENSLASYIKDKWFEMTLNVLRDDNERGDKEMMKLIRYGGAAEDASSSGNDKGSLVAGS